MLTTCATATMVMSSIAQTIPQTSDYEKASSYTNAADVAAVVNHVALETITKKLTFHALTTKALKLAMVPYLILNIGNIGVDAGPYLGTGGADYITGAPCPKPLSSSQGTDVNRIPGDNNVNQNNEELPIIPTTNITGDPTQLVNNDSQEETDALQLPNDNNADATPCPPANGGGQNGGDSPPTPNGKTQLLVHLPTVNGGDSPTTSNDNNATPCPPANGGGQNGGDSPPTPNDNNATPYPPANGGGQNGSDSPPTPNGNNATPYPPANGGGQNGGDSSQTTKDNNADAIPYPPANGGGQNIGESYQN
ncbi:unnamed protein product [Peronospora belbahrii]|uniref:Uncharacterized protein n=1 Tax=Peronospora belbahrii TaxID=622444 RepID=A0AAU9KYM6_9STRA|nr:unnamed protein product [Peronospora belbahrii]